MKEVHDYLFARYALLDRVVRARKLHHSRFYALDDLDYGHKVYLDQLVGQRFTIARALERLERRTSEVLYEKRQWFKWVRQCQDEEEQHRDNEKKKVQREAALFKSHWKEMQSRLQTLRAKENQKRQEAYLEEAWEARMLESDDSTWDPIEDVIEDERGNYVDMIKHFLWLPASMASEDTGLMEQTVADAPAADAVPNSDHAQNWRLPSEDAARVQTADPENAPKKKKKKKKSKVKLAQPESKTPQDSASTPRPSKDNVETEAELRSRLRSPETFNDYTPGQHIFGTVHNPAELADRTATLSNEEIDHLVPEISEIKILLFCRLLLSHAALLPTALRAESVDEFLADTEVTDSDLRDLCLQMEAPGLQQIRDACADLSREEEQEIDEDIQKESEDAQGLVSRKDAFAKFKDLRIFDKRVKGYERKKAAIPHAWKSKREAQLMKRRKATNDGTGTFVDFGDIDEDGEFSRKRMRVKVCGRYIWNYSSEGAMSRNGWLQFSILAKSCSLFKAIELCRNWEEFFELNILALYHYFPASQWRAWSSDTLKQELLHQVSGYESSSMMRPPRSRPPVRLADYVEITGFYSILRNGPR